MEIHEIVLKLTGPVNPRGESDIDSKRFENLKELAGVVEPLIQELTEVAKQRDSKFGSIMGAGKMAHKFLNRIVAELLEEDTLNPVKLTREQIEQAHMAGQFDAGVDPSYSNARAYFDEKFGGKDA